MDKPTVKADAVNMGLNRKEVLLVVTFCFMNIANYMDRYAVAGVLWYLQRDFGIEDDLAGLLHTGFIVIYMLASPFYGYVADRYSRKAVMLTCMLIWSAAAIATSFAHSYWLFFGFRGVLAIGQAGFTTVAPIVISDISLKKTRTIIYGCFYLATPLGSGLGYIFSSSLTKAYGNWHWALLTTSCFGILGIVAFMFLTFPKRGEKEAALGIQAIEPTSYKDDINIIGRTKSFLLVTAAFTCVAYFSGAFSWWVPKFLHAGSELIADGESYDESNSATFYGCITVVTGILGVMSGSLLSSYMRPKFPWIDPVICCIGMLLAIPFIECALFAVPHSTLTAFSLIFCGQLFLNFNWSIECDIIMYVTAPARRGTAHAMHMLISHAFGDAIGPYIVGATSVYFKTNLDFRSRKSFLPFSVRSLETPLTLSIIPTEFHFQSLHLALSMVVCVLLVGALCFLSAAFYVIADKKKAGQTD